MNNLLKNEDIGKIDHAKVLELTNRIRATTTIYAKEVDGLTEMEVGHAFLSCIFSNGLQQGIEVGLEIALTDQPQPLAKCDTGITPGNA